MAKKPQLSDEQKLLLKEQCTSLELTRSTVLTKKQCDSVIEEIKNAFSLKNIQINEFEAFTILAITAQQGGTARGCSGNYNFGYKGINIKLSIIRNCFKNSINDRYGLRKFARTHASYFHEICYNCGKLQGNLSNKIKNITEIEISEGEAVWLSDYQADNEACPEKLRKLIKLAFKTKKKK